MAKYVQSVSLPLFYFYFPFFSFFFILSSILSSGYPNLSVCLPVKKDHIQVSQHQEKLRGISQVTN